MHEEHHHEHNDFDATQIEADNLAVCPVMEGTPVDKEEAEKEGRVREYKGKKYYLCCSACEVDFDANPEQFAE